MEFYLILNIFMDLHLSYINNLLFITNLKMMQDTAMFYLDIHDDLCLLLLLILNILLFRDLHVLLRRILQFVFINLIVRKREIRMKGILL